MRDLIIEKLIELRLHDYDYYFTCKNLRKYKMFIQTLTDNLLLEKYRELVLEEMRSQNDDPDY